MQQEHAVDVLVECVPNFSEGRTVEVVRALVACVESAPGVFLLDQEMDWDHHRSVLTYVGSPDATAEAAVNLARKARDLIDLRTHQGGHPRVGATDVVPFIPIRGITMDDCIALAKRVGQRIGSELDIPVFLYERASSRPGRVNLEDIRRGGLEGLAQRMAGDPAWTPDFGPPSMHPTAGATVVGVRPSLIAYNVDLQGEDLATAKAIAKSVRASGGGLPAVKAIGVEMKSRRRVQVSMNLTNVDDTPIHTAFDAVKREAAQHGIEVERSEIIGLVPQAALLQVVQARLQLKGFTPDQVLETRLEKVLSEKPPSRGDWNEGLSRFLSAVSAGTPTPGGGSVASLGGALAASLGLMACRATVATQQRTQGSATPSPNFSEMEERLTTLQQRMAQLIHADAAAYEAVLKGYRMPKDHPSRAQAIAESLRVATEVPLESASLADETAMLLVELRDRVKPAVKPDLKVGLLMAVAAIAGGVENADENLKALQNQPVPAELRQRVEYLRERLVELRTVC